VLYAFYLFYLSFHPCARTPPAPRVEPLASNSPVPRVWLTLSECLFFFGIYSFHYCGPTGFASEFLKAAMPQPFHTYTKRSKHRFRTPHANHPPLGLGLGLGLGPASPPWQHRLQTGRGYLVGLRGPRRDHYGLNGGRHRNRDAIPEQKGSAQNAPCFP